MTQEIKNATSQTIKGDASVKNFIKFCVDGTGLGIGFHPENSFHDYVNKSTGKKFFTTEESNCLDKTLKECKEECFTIHKSLKKIWLKIYQPHFDKSFK